MQIHAAGILAPHHAQVRHVQMIVPDAMQQVIGIVHAIRDDHPVERVSVRRLDPIRDAAFIDIDWRLFDLDLAGLRGER